jgi:hypothetical protein
MSRGSTGPTDLRSRRRLPIQNKADPAAGCMLQPAWLQLLQCSGQRNAHLGGCVSRRTVTRDQGTPTLGQSEACRQRQEAPRLCSRSRELKLYCCRTGRRRTNFQAACCGRDLDMAPHHPTHSHPTPLSTTPQCKLYLYHPSHMAHYQLQTQPSYRRSPAPTHKTCLLSAFGDLK